MFMIVDLKLIDCQLFLQQKRVYFGSTKNCNSGFASLVSHVQVPNENGEVNSLRGGKEAGRARVHWRN